MTGPWPEGGGGGFAADYKKASSRPPSFRPKRSGVEKSPSSDCTGGITAGDLSRLRFFWEVFESDPYRLAAPLEMTVASGTPIVISTVAKRSGEISLHHGTGSIEAGYLSTQSIIGAVTVCPIPTRSPARDDGGSRRPSRHFDRSGAEWRNLTPLMTEKLPPSPSFRRKRCGVEKSPSSDGTGGITEGDLSAQSIIGASSICLPYRHAATLEMTKEPCLDRIKKAPPAGRLCL